MSEKWEVVSGKQRKPRQPKPQVVTGITTTDVQIVPGLGKTASNGTTKHKKRSAKVPAPFPIVDDMEDTGSGNKFLLIIMNLKGRMECVGIKLFRVKFAVGDVQSVIDEKTVNPSHKDDTKNQKASNKPQQKSKSAVEKRSDITSTLSKVLIESRL